MFENDTVMRMIRQLILALARLAGVKREDPQLQVQAALESVNGELLGFDMQLLRMLPVNQILSLTGGGHEGNLRALLAAEVLRLQAQDAPDSIDLQDKALGLYLHGLDGETPLPVGALQLLAERLRGENPPDVQLVVQYLPVLVMDERYSEVEDTLFLALEQRLSESQQALLFQTGVKILEQMSGLNDFQLIRGGLPREELLQCQQTFEQMMQDAAKK